VARQIAADVTAAHRMADKRDLAQVELLDERCKIVEDDVFRS
jgi:hypothetical protein